LYLLKTYSLLVLLLEKLLYKRHHHFEERSGVVKDEGFDSLWIAILQKPRVEKKGRTTYVITVIQLYIAYKVMLSAVE